MHDANGELLAVGDIVSLDCVITAVHPQEDYCNVMLQSVLPPEPTSMGACSVLCNSRQVIKSRQVVSQAPASNATASADAGVTEPGVTASPEPQQPKASSINR
jgi:hypothetical protein